jgi:hypothetical protein
MDWIHTEHCLHASLDHLPGYVQYDVFNSIKVEGDVSAEPELTPNRKCRDLNVI